MENESKDAVLGVLLHICEIRTASGKAKLNAQQKERITGLLDSLNREFERIFVERLAEDFPLNDEQSYNVGTEHRIIKHIARVWE